MAFNSYDIATTSLVKTGILTEMYIPLWFYSSNSFNTNDNVSGSSGGAFIGKGSSSLVGSNAANAVLHTLNSKWSNSQKFAFEVSFYSSDGSAVNAQLYDITANGVTAINGSLITTTSKTFTLIRSGQFTLTPGHAYGISVWAGTGYVYLSKASLIAFLS